MRNLFSILTVLLITTWPVEAGIQEREKPNALTPKEIADGWLLLFDGETTFGWKVDGEVHVDYGYLVLGGTKETTATFTTQFAYGNVQFAALTDKAKDAELTFNAYKGPFIQVAPPTEKGWNRFIAQAMPDDVSLYASGSKGIRAAARGDQPTAIAFHVPAGQKLILRDILFWPRRWTPIFNGKDLAGWKEIPDKKSKFSVTPEGWLNVKDGPGDLQTEAQWADFVLQLDVFSNGRHLNSGVFFRCIPGAFWSGYEAQIRNQWEGNDRTKAVDYGTGGIYNRQPARKVVSSDKEWFTMTVVAHGKHLAVWVNGYQTADFTDTRPPNESARKGAKVGKGPISLQGHDPTTDLSFRNLRIAEMPEAPKN